VHSVFTEPSADKEISSGRSSRTYSLDDVSSQTNRFSTGSDVSSSIQIEPTSNDLGNHVIIEIESDTDVSDKDFSSRSSTAMSSFATSMTSSDTYSKQCLDKFDPEEELSIPLDTVQKVYSACGRSDPLSPPGPTIVPIDDFNVAECGRHPVHISPHALVPLYVSNEMEQYLPPPCTPEMQFSMQKVVGHDPSAEQSSASREQHLTKPGYSGTNSLMDCNSLNSNDVALKPEGNLNIIGQGC